MGTFGDAITDYHFLDVVICWQLIIQPLDRILRILDQTDMAIFAHHLNFTLEPIMELDSFLGALLLILILLGSTRFYICLLCWQRL